MAFVFHQIKVLKSILHTQIFETRFFNHVMMIWLFWYILDWRLPSWSEQKSCWTFSFTPKLEINMTIWMIKEEVEGCSMTLMSSSRSVKSDNWKNVSMKDSRAFAAMSSNSFKMFTKLLLNSIFHTRSWNLSVVILSLALIYTPRPIAWFLLWNFPLLWWISKMLKLFTLKEWP